ncbi:MAG: hypothetical protein PVH03_01600 [Chloroflexota bacterium]|jgi:hypothetical protein
MAVKSTMGSIRSGNLIPSNILSSSSMAPRTILIGVILILALFAFEMFNFDTTRYALSSLLGDVRFAGLAWATILAVAFCAIDFAGLARLFTPERGLNEPKEIWYLTGAWLLGATMNAIMTWWAVSLVLLESQLGNEVLSRDQLLNIVPIFVAILVWLTRILFIGAITLAGERLLHGNNRPRVNAPASTSKNSQPSAANQPTRPSPKYAKPMTKDAAIELSTAPAQTGSKPTRVHRRPPRPNFNSSARNSYRRSAPVSKDS